MSALVVYYYAVDPHSDLPLERSPIKLIEIAIGPNRVPMPKVSEVASARRSLEAASPPPWRDNVPEQRTKYAAVLLDQKIETETPAGMCARMELVRDVATEAGDCATALKANENIYATFAVSAHALNSMNADVLKKALSATLNSTAIVETQK